MSENIMESIAHLKRIYDGFGEHSIAQIQEIVSQIEYPLNHTITSALEHYDKSNVQKKLDALTLTDAGYKEKDEDLIDLHHKKMLYFSTNFPDPFTYNILFLPDQNAEIYLNSCLWKLTECKDFVDIIQWSNEYILYRVNDGIRAHEEDILREYLINYMR